ncbi:nucleotide exchange factor GrpE [Acidaminococcus timonensis]|jgi:molecular chaperone GrpE|uniref:nucleotide exchange factor GrpE n=1 Tax=Acidaminococcus TaxID=904 RepID=UPI0025FFD7CF|nr:nucleotide exchange factor GrpE [Acidaminococcus timonensis]MDD6569941.1 nucleotide exchange factor GrpE [Acidaminococcus sp.]
MEKDTQKEAETVKAEAAQAEAKATEAAAKDQAAAADQADKAEKKEEQAAPDPKDVKIAAQEKQIADLQNRLLRLQADFDNFRKRNNEERERLGRYVTGQVAREFLKVLDNFERAEASLKTSKDDNALQVGMEKIHKQFEKALQTLHIEEIPAEGKPFDPNIHEAVMQGSNPDLPDESIDLVLEKGYKIGDDVIRHSKVRVVRND